MTAINLNKIKSIYLTNLFILFFAFVSISNSQENFDEQIKKLNDVISTSYKSHYNPTNASELIDAAIKGMIKELDPHSYYFNKEALKSIDERRTGGYIGVGFNYFIYKDTIVVLSLDLGSPSSQSKMQIGDKIIKVNGKSVAGMNSKDFDKLLRGERGEPINFDVKRNITNESINIKMKKTRLPMNSVSASYMIQGTNIGYISINSFVATTYIDMIDSLSLLVENGMENLILDLRNNSGGLVDQAYMVADEFIYGGYNIVYTKGRRSEFNDIYRSTAGGTFENIKLIVLIDENTASAPEIIAGAIQDLDRGLIVGETSFGKGLVQRQYKLIDGSELWLTVSEYYTPSGRCIQKTYKNNKNYGTLADRINLEEGMNVKHNLEVVEFTSDSVPVYRTLKGRPVLGGGGITPDYIVKYDSLSQFTKDLIDKNIISKVALYYVAKNKNISKGPISFETFRNNFNLDDDMILKLKSYANDNNITWEDNSFILDSDTIKLNIQATIAGILWSNKEKGMILNQGSKYIKKAVELFPIVNKILDN